jgi:hypothetical protein
MLLAELEQENADLRTQLAALKADNERLLKACRFLSEIYREAMVRYMDLKRREDVYRSSSV